jgi:hypothetical protein
MGIRDFIRDEVFGRLLRGNRSSGVLVVYDADGRYRDICRAMADDERLTLVDASESSIESRETAMAALPGVALAGPTARELLIYIPRRPPVTDEERQDDPFAPYGVFGALFPSGDGDDYLSLCLKAKSDHATEIRRLFAENPNPPFQLIDNIGGGLKWPTLRTLLSVESARDILLALMVPTEKQKDALKADDSWVMEAKALFEASLGLRLLTKGKTWSSIADELWRFVLYSEFRFDLPAELPASLADVPHAATAARPVVEELCDTLRNDQRHRPTYIDRAEATERDLKLPEACHAIEDLGIRDTFPFEERTFLSGAVRALKEDRLDGIRAIVHRHGRSVWIGKGESQAQWDLLKSALALVEACEDGAERLSGKAHGMDGLIDLYVESLRLVDQRQREFEQAVGDHVALDANTTAVIEQARTRYGKLVLKVQTVFTRHLETVGWPPPGRLANADVFDRHVAPLLAESGRKVAMIIVDALRYELGVALVNQLTDGDEAAITHACAQLPTVTPVGMASLLPGAGAGLSLKAEDDGFVPMLDGTRVASVAQRMDVLRARYGDRFHQEVLATFAKSPPKLPSTVALLVLRDTEIDSHLESNPETTLGLLQATLKRIRVAIHRLKDLGFNDVVIATDHGFFLNGHAEAGDLCGKPPGNWVTVHDRALLGTGAGDAGNFAIPATKAGIRGDFEMLAGPRTMAPYRRGMLYFHGGASLQEAIVPVLTVRLRKEKQPGVATATVRLAYKGGKTKITTRLPVIEVSVESTDIFSRSADFEIQLEAQNRKGEVVGEPKPGGNVNPATGTINLRPGETKAITVRMQTEFEGKFTLKALNPTTQTTFATLDLETDYVG